MSVHVIDTIKPKNNGTFPVVEAVDVKVTNDKRLDAALNDKANQSDLEALSETVSSKADKTALAETNAAVAGKQDTLTTEQLAAVNSGITDTLVTQIGTNTTAIAGKASATDLAATNATVATKAAASDVANLQGQIDQIVISSAAETVVAPEVAQARTGVDNHEYSTLKDRLDAEQNKQTASIEDLEYVTSNVYDRYPGSENIFDKRKLIINHGYSGSTGELLENNTYSCTIKFPKKSGYICVRSSQLAYRVCKWDANGNFIEKKDSTYAAFPAAGETVAFMYRKADLVADTLMIGYTHETSGRDNDTWTDIFGSDYIPYVEKYTLTDAVTIPDVVTLENSVEKLESDEAKFIINSAGKNKYNPDELLVGYGYSSSDGSLVQNSSYKSTPLIPIEEEYAYIRTTVPSYRVVLYDSTKTMVRYYDTHDTVNAYINGAKYAAFMYLADDDLSNLMICFIDSTSQVTDYEPMKYGFNTNNLVIPAADLSVTNRIMHDLSSLVSVDTDYQSLLTLQGTEGTKVWYEVVNDFIPKTVLNVSVFGKTDKIDDGTSTYGAYIDIRFYGKDNAVIGNKFIMNIISMSRYGYHNYQAISPAGTAYYKLKIITVGATKMEIKSIEVNKIDAMPMRDDNSVVYDCHLGTLLAAPKNTMSAYEMAKIAGFKNLIINVKSTSDDVMVAIHDTTIDATSDGTGNVAEYTYDELLTFDFGSWFNKCYTGERIPKIDDVLRFIATSGMNVIFSLHSANTTAEIDKLYLLCKKYCLLGNCMFKSYDTNQLEYVYSVFGNDCLYDLCSNNVLNSGQKTWIQNWGNLDYVEYAGYDAITAESVAEVKNLGCEVIGGITSSPIKVADAIKCGVKRFTSDMCADLVV